MLYVAWGFPPCRGSGVYRALATANALDAMGFDVTVLTVRREVFQRYTGLDPSLEALVASGITVRRLDFDWPLLEHDIARWPRSRAQNPGAWAARRQELELADFPESRYGPWQSRLLEAADEIAAERRVDLVVCTANPNVDFVVGHHLSRTRGIPYVMDYRDAWRLDVFTGDLLPLDPRVPDLEAAFIADAAEIWFVNDPIRAWHAREYPEAAGRMFTVMNGFDRDLAPRVTEARPEPGAPLRFGYVGTLTRAVPLAEFVAGWRHARAADDTLLHSSAQLWGHLGFYATENRGLTSRVEAARRHGVTFHGPVDKADVAALYESFDVLLLILGTGRYVTSGKVFEYMASGLPIVSVHDPQNAASDVLAGYPLWFPVRDLGKESIAEALSRAAAAAPSVTPETRRACAEHAAAFERSRQLRAPLERLRRLVEEQR